MTSCEGEEITMYDELAAGNAVVINFSAMWCAPCQDLALDMQQIWEYYGHGTGGVKVFEFLVSDQNYETTDCDDVASWNSQFDLTFPGFSDCEDVFLEYDEIYGSSVIPIILVYLPDVNDPGESVLLYDYLNGIGAETNDVFIDIKNLLNEYGYSYVGMEETTEVPKELIRIVDLYGRPAEFKPNVPLIYLYSDGTSECIIKSE